MKQEPAASADKEHNQTDQARHQSLYQASTMVTTRGFSSRNSTAPAHVTGTSPGAVDQPGNLGPTRNETTETAQAAAANINANVPSVGDRVPLGGPEPRTVRDLPELDEQDDDVQPPLEPVLTSDFIELDDRSKTGKTPFEAGHSDEGPKEGDEFKYARGNTVSYQPLPITPLWADEPKPGDPQVDLIDADLKSASIRSPGLGSSAHWGVIGKLE